MYNFEWHHRVFRDSIFVELSLDNFQTVAGRYRFHEEITTNNSSANPDYVSVNISSSAGSQSNVYFRFMYEGEWDYAIMIDDVSFFPDGIPIARNKKRRSMLQIIINGC